MAGTLALNVEILGAFNKLTTATTGATGQLNRLSTTAKSISATMNRAFGAIGVGFSLAIITRELKEASQAAIEDAKSMDILSIAMINTGKATQGTVTQAEALIQAMSLQTAVADDQLRPAFQKLFIATGNVEESNRLLAIALDTSAATGKDLDAVTQAMSRSLAGNDTALNRLIPSLKGVDDPMSELERTFRGAAEAAANVDPYQRMEVAFGEIQESVGTVLQPVLNEFADYLVESVPKIQAFFTELLDPTSELGSRWSKLGKTFDRTRIQFEKLLQVFGIAPPSFETTLDFVTLLTAGFGQLFFMVGEVAKIIKAVLSLDFAQAFDIATNFAANYGNFVESQNSDLGLSQGGGGGGSQEVRSVTINVNNGNVTAQEIADKINKANRSTGTNLIR
jgi:hypothetical protein